MRRQIMEHFIINVFDTDKVLVSLLDYEEKITEYISSIKLMKYNDRQITIDSALNSGLNNYRFISIQVDKSGSLLINTAKYEMVDEDIITFANTVLSSQKQFLINSILTKKEKEYLMSLTN